MARSDSLFPSDCDVDIDWMMRLSCPTESQRGGFRMLHDTGVCIGPVALHGHSVGLSAGWSLGLSNIQFAFQSTRQT